jgi:hypothetical protein
MAMINYYASPTGTGTGLTADSPASIVEAKALVRGRVAAGLSDNITVWLEGGVYRLTETLQFRAEDSGTPIYKIMWRAVPGQLPVFSGGQQIQGWTAVANKPWLYKANVALGSKFEALYVNGVSAPRAHVQIEGNSHILECWEFSDDVNGTFGAKIIFFDESVAVDLTSSINKQDIELCFHWYRWATARAKCSGQITVGYDPQWGNGVYTLYGFGPTMEFSDSPRRTEYEGYGYEYPDYSPSMYTLLTDPMWRGHAYPGGFDAFNGYFKFDNVFEALRSGSGHFYLDRRASQPVVYYAPKAGEVISQLEIIAPVLSSAIEINNARHLMFVGIDVQHCRDQRIIDVMFSESGTFANAQYLHEFTDLNVSDIEPLAAVEVEYSQNVHFIQCSTTHCVRGFNLGAGTQDCSVSGGFQRELDGNAFALNGPGWLYGIYDAATTTAPIDTEDLWRVNIKNDLMRNKNNKITSNKITRIGNNGASPAIFAQGVEKLTIEHNRFFDLPYMPMVLRGNFIGRYFPYNNIIRKNLSHDILKTKQDGGSLYASGGQIGLVFTENVTYDWNAGSDASLIFPIYLDDNSHGMTATKNIILPNTKGASQYWGCWKNYPADFFIIPENSAPWPVGEFGISTTYPNRIVGNYYHNTLAFAGNKTPYSATGEFSGNTPINGSNPATWPSEVTRIVNEAGLQKLLATDIIDGEVIVYGWRDSAEETITVTASSGTVQHYEEPLDLMWRARVVGITEEGLTVYANGKSITIGQATTKNPIFRGDGSRAGNILKGDGSKGGIVMKNNGGTWSPN